MNEESNLPFCFFKALQKQNVSAETLLNKQLDITTLIGSTIITIFVMLSNLMLIYGLYRTTKQPMSTTKKLFIYLSCTDIMTTLIGEMKHILSYHIRNCIILLALTSVNNVFFCLGMEIFSTISILRYLSLKNPFQNVGKRRIHLILLIETVVSTLIGVCYFSFLYDIEESTMIAIQFVVTILYFLMVSSLLLINLLSYITIRSNIKCGVTASNDNKQSGNGNSHDVTDSDCINEKKNKRKKYAVNTLIIISVFYMFCHLPMCIYFFIATVKSLETSYNFSSYARAYQISNFLLFVVWSNNGFNAAILIIRSKDILQFYSLVIIRRWIDNFKLRRGDPNSLR